MKVLLKNIVFLILSGILGNNVTFAQNGLISVSDVNACYDDQINIPVDAHGLDNVGAITLYLHYNLNSLEFDTVHSVTNLLPGLMYNNIIEPGIVSIGTIAVSWSGFAPVNLFNEELFVMSFRYLGTNDSIIFNNYCEIADFDANIMNVGYSDCAVSLSEEIQITFQPEDLFLYDSESGSFEINAVNVDLYSWEYRINDVWIEVPEMIYFYGQYSNELQIINPIESFNGLFFRCKLRGCNIHYSDSVLLSVETNTINYPNKEEDIIIYPNPGSRFINLKLNNNTAGFYSICLRNITGGVTENLFKDVFFNTNEIKEINISDLSQGSYIIEIIPESGDQELYLSKNIIILENK